MSQSLTEEEIDQIIEEGDDANLLLDNPAFIRAIETLRAGYAEDILQSPPEASAQREHLYRLSTALTEITETLTEMAADGENYKYNRKLQEEPDLPLMEDDYHG